MYAESLDTLRENAQRTRIRVIKEALDVTTVKVTVTSLETAKMREEKDKTSIEAETEVETMAVVKVLSATTVVSMVTLLETALMVTTNLVLSATTVKILVTLLETVKMRERRDMRIDN